MKNWKSCLTAALALAATTVFAAEPLLLQWGTIDTSGSAAQAESAALKAKVAKKAALARARKSAAPEERAAYIVQFPGPVTEEWRTWLEASTQVRGYLPEFAYLVWATATEMETIAANPDVFWTGEWKKDYKTVLAIPSSAKSTASASEVRWMQIGSFLTGDEGAADLHARLEALPAEVQDAFPRLDGSSAVAFLTDAQIDEVAAWPDVEWIEPKLRPRLFNDQAARTNMMNVSNVWKSLSSGGLGLTGSGQIVAVADTGCDMGSISNTHADFAGRILAGYGWTNGAYKSSASWADLDAHGTHVCGSILGSGAASTNLYRGMAYEAQLVIQGMWEDLGGLPDHTASLLKQAYSAGARIHSDSWGYGTNYAGAYVYDSVYSDGYMWTNQIFIMVIAAGNDGIDADSDGVIDAGSVTAPGTAKNCICVGAAENYRTNGGYAASTYGARWPSDYPADPIKSDKISQTKSPQGIVAFSSRGPTLDGRFKPDIVAPGTDVISVRSRASDDTGWGLNSANTNYIYMGGTSMATPLTSGTMALIRQWLVDRKGINEPMAALMKALLINGARDMTPGQYGTGSYQEITARPDRSQGFGHVNLYNSLEPGDGNFLVFATNKLTTSANFTTNIAVGQPNAGTYVLTLVWQDYPGSSGGAKNLVNDLDLTVTSPSGTVYYPNNLSGLDHTNNVEFIEFTATETGSYAVKVNGYSVSKTSPNGGQPFALVMRGPETVVEEVAPAFSSATSSTNGVQYADIDFDFRALLTAGYPTPVYTLTTSVSTNEYEFDDDTGYLYFQPANAGTFTFRCVASNSLGSATNTLTVTVAPIPPAVPSGLFATDIGGFSFTANWSPALAADAYILDVATVSGSGGNSNLVSESFSSITSTDTEITSSLDTYTTLPGWTGSKVFTATGQLKLGSGSANGWIATPALDIPEGSVLSCKITKYSGDTGTVAIKISTDGGSTWSDLVSSITPVSAGETNTYTFTQAYTSAKIQFVSSAKRFYLDDIVLSVPSTSYTSLPGYSLSVGAATNAAVTGLSPATDYAFRVQSTNAAGASAWSGWCPVTTDSTDYAPYWTDFPYSTVQIDVGFPYELDLSACATGQPSPEILLVYTDAEPDDEYLFGDGLLVFTPARADTYDFDFIASNYLGTTTATLRIQTTATSPTLSFGFDPEDVRCIAVGEADEFTVTAYGTPAPVLSCTTTDAVENDEYTFNPATGAFFFLPNTAGTYEFTFTATNIAGRDSETVTISVDPERVTVPTLTVTNIAATSATAVWTPCTGISTYFLQLATDDRFTYSSGSVTTTNLFNNPANSSTAPDGWTYDIDSASSGYLILRHGHTVVSEAVDTTSCESLSLSFSMRTYGGTSYSNVLVQYSTDDGSTWLDASTTNTTKGTTWIYPTMLLPSGTTGHSSLRLRFASTTPSGSTAGIGIMAIVLTGNLPAAGSLVLDTIVTDATRYAFTNLVTSNTYYARVRGGTNGWSNVEEFTPQATPAPLADYEQWLVDHGVPAGTPSTATNPATGQTYGWHYVADIPTDSTDLLSISIPDPADGTFTIPSASSNRHYYLLYTTDLSLRAYSTNDLETPSPTTPIPFPTNSSWYGGLRVTLP